MKETVIFSEHSTGRQELGSDHRYLQRLPAQADQLVQQEEQRRRYQIDVEARLLDQAVAAVNDRLLNGSTPSNPAHQPCLRTVNVRGSTYQGVHDHVEAMRQPECAKTDAPEVA